MEKLKCSFIHILLAYYMDRKWPRLSWDGTGRFLSVVLMHLELSGPLLWAAVNVKGHHTFSLPLADLQSNKQSSVTTLSYPELLFHPLRHTHTQTLQSENITDSLNRWSSATITDMNLLKMEITTQRLLGDKDGRI